MRKFKFEKLVRDKISEKIKKENSVVTERILEDEEYLKELNKKLKEEVLEYLVAENEDILGELADVYEILESIKKVLNILDNEILEERDKKANKNGLFEKRTYIDYIEVEEKNPWAQYYLDNSDRYPEIS